jgi:hypothetical protein
MPSLPIQIDEIDDIPVTDTVYDISHGASQNEHKTESEKPAGRTRSKKSCHYQSTDDDPHRDKKPSLPATRISQKTECRALIQYQCQIKPRYNSVYLA